MTSGGKRGVSGGGGGGGVINIDANNNLHLKKELTQIRKAARVLKDPGTSSSPLISSRSITNNHYYVHKNNNNVVGINDSCSDGNAAAKTVFLCNWRNQKSESDDESRKMIVKDDVENVSSTSGSKSGGKDSCLSNGYGSANFRCKDSNFSPSIRRSIRKKSKRSGYSSASSRLHKEKVRLLLSKYTNNVVNNVSGSSLGRDDSVSLVDQSDDTEDFCNSEDLARAYSLSPFLARLKNNKRWSYSPTKSLRSDKKEDDHVSYSTPALSTSLYNKYSIRNPSTIDSWDTDDDMDDRLDLPGQQGCGIPCYWSRRSTPKSRSGSCCSSSLSDTLRKKGRHRRLSSKTVAQSLVPLLKNRAVSQGSSIGSVNSDDEISSNFGELHLEALSRLDGKRWCSSCRSREGLELVALNGEVIEENSPENMKSLSHKYRPMFFEELIGQNIVVKALTSAVSRKRIAPLYLFHGPRGIGKTSTARIFAAALNCLATEETKPCGVCRECADFMSGKSRCFGEVDGSNKRGVEKLNELLNKIPLVYPSSLSQYKVFVVDECHLLPSRTWLSLLGLLEKLLPRVVFILITADIDNVPRAIVSRCQKHIFNQISNGDIVSRLRKISSDEGLDVESNALELIASSADGSLRDAETMLDQLSLFGKRITTSLVNELIGVVSDDKLLDLLELAMSSNATETVIRARELMDLGVDPIVLMSQLVTLIVDVIAGTYPSFDAKNNDSFFGGRSLTERDLDKLKHALTLLSEAEKRLRVSSERPTWFTATLLQLGSLSSPDRKTQSKNSRRLSSKATEEDSISIPEKAAQRNSTSEEKPLPTDANNFDSKSNQSQLVDCKSGRTKLTRTESKMLIDIWLQCIDKCHSKTLRQLLHSYGKLVSISELNGGFVAHIAFEDTNIKTRAEGFLSSITNSFEIVIQRNVEVKLIHLNDNLMNLEHKSMRCNSDLVSRGSFKNVSEESVARNASISTSKDSNSDIPLRRIESIINEQRLESARLNGMEKNTPGSTSRSKPERNQVLPQDNPNELELMNSLDVPSKHWEDELNHEIKALKINDGARNEKDSNVKRIDHCPISPSLLHNRSYANDFSKDNIGYESGSGAGGCSGIFCWNNSRPHKRAKAKQGTPTRARKGGRFSWFRECAKSRQTYNR